jgi:hypothetical protein
MRSNEVKFRFLSNEFVSFHETLMHPHRKIICVDMDAFYASVEQRDSPKY